MGDGLKFEGRNDRIFLFSDRTCLCFHRGTKGKEKIQRPCLIFAHKAESIRANLTDPVSNINTSNKGSFGQTVVGQEGGMLNNGNHRHNGGASERGVGGGAVFRFNKAKCEFIARVLTYRPGNSRLWEQCVVVGFKF